MFTGYIGTYNTETTKGIYSFSFDEQTGTISNVVPFFSADDAKCVDNYEHNLIITTKKQGKCGIALIDIATKSLIDEILLEDNSPCFVKYNNGFIYTANYHDGVVMVYKVVNNKLTLVKKIENCPKAGCHQVVLYQNYLIVPCLLLDEVRIFDTTKDFALVKTLHFPQGTGPRHGIFNQDESHFYLVSELSSEFFDFEVGDNLEFNLKTKLHLLPEEKLPGSTTAAIRMTNDNKFIYVSTRGADVITVINIEKTPTIIQQVSAYGSHPRDFLLSNDENYLLVVNRDSDDLSSVLRDKQTGKLLNSITTEKLPHGVGIILV